MARKYFNDPLDAEWSDDMIRRAKWSNPSNEMTYEEIKRAGDGDFILGGMRITARFLGLPEPYFVDDDDDDDDLAGDVAFHKSLLLNYIGELPHFHADKSDPLMVTALRLHDLHPDAWQRYVDKYDIDEDDQRKIYGVEPD